MRVPSSPWITITLAYWLAGHFALGLAIPPGYTAPFFPSAGIALSALIICGLRYWPAVLAGSALVQLAATWPLIGTPDWNPLGPMIVPLGATLQAVAGAALARRLIGFPSTLDTPAAVARLLAIVVPTSSLVSCTIAVSALIWAEVIPPAGALFNWWSWWAGDTLGALVAVPLMFVFFGRPQNEWRPRRLAVALPLAVALVLLTLAYRQVAQWEELRIRAQFDRDATHLTHLLQMRLDRHIEMMRSLERLFAVSEDVTATDFSAFVTPWIARHAGTQSFGWNPLVRDADRDGFESAARAGGLAGFSILDRDAAGQTAPAMRRAEYLPILYIAPPGVNDSALGLDPLSFAVAAEAIGRARASGQPAASARMRLVQETGQQHGVAVYLPVFRPRAGTDSAAGADVMLGVVTATFRLGDVVAAALEGSRSPSIERCLVDLDAADPETCLAGEHESAHPGWDQGALAYAAPISFAGRHWELRLRATPEYMRQLQSWAAWATVAVGLLATAMLGALLLITTGANRRINALVVPKHHISNYCNSTRTSRRCLARKDEGVAPFMPWLLGADAPSWTPANPYGRNPR